MADILDEIRDAYEYDTNNWQKIHDEGKIDMRYVAGDPWTTEDKKLRKKRPTVAPEEMSQYRNQVINSLMTNPRGMRFSPVGMGANDKGAQFYQSKAREIEYRSHAKQVYIIAADNALQRSYGWVRVDVRYASHRDVNQEIWIEALPNPDMVLPDTDALKPDSSDMKRCIVHQWISQAQFKKDYKGAKIKNFKDWERKYPEWIQGDKIMVSEYWAIQTRKRKLLLVQPSTRPGSRQPEQPVKMFDDEFAKISTGGTVVRELRDVDYPDVKMWMTNGVELLSDAHPWVGKYIPIVSCFGKVLYMETDDGIERKILSMTRFGRDPWKSYCYASSAMLEVLAQVPKSSVVAYEGQLAGHEREWQESRSTPKAWLYAKAMTAATGENVLPLPKTLDNVQAQYLQAIESVAEHFRRSIQSAMASNFLPSEAQHRSQKSGIALENIQKSAERGTYHFVNAYEDMIRQIGVICEDLIDKIHDYKGETGIIEDDGKSVSQPINDPSNPKSISTRGDYVVTVSTGPSSDSDRDAAEQFTDTIMSNIQMIASISGPKPAAALVAKAIKMRLNSPQGDQMSALIEPEEYKQKDGQEPKSPALMQAEQKIQELTGILQKAAQEKQSKVVEQQGKFAIASMQEQAESERAAADREVKLAVAELGAKVDRMALLVEESQMVGTRTHDAMQSGRDHAHEAAQNAKDRLHEHVQSALAHERAQELTAQTGAQQADLQQQAADAASQESEP